MDYDRSKIYSCLEPYSSSATQTYQNYSYNYLPSQSNQNIETTQFSERSSIYTNIHTSTAFDKPNGILYGALNEQRKRGRKPKNEMILSRQENKLNRNSNKRYFNYKGVEVKPKEFVDYQCKCIKKCYHKLRPEERIAEFEKFWALSAYDAQTAYIAAKVSEHPVRKRYGKNATTKKDYSRIYSLCSTTVCREMFCKTLQISSGRINTALTKLRKKTAINDQRGMKKQTDILLHKNWPTKTIVMSCDNSNSILCDIEKGNTIQNDERNNPNDQEFCTTINISSSIDTANQGNIKDNIDSTETSTNGLLDNSEISSCERNNSNVTTAINICSIIYSKPKKTLNDNISKHNYDVSNLGKPITYKKGRKLKYTQTREENKLNRNSNKPYVNYKGKLVEPKEFVDFKCKCCKKCHQNINIVDRYTEFKKFWTLPYNSQTVYILAAVIEQPVKKHYSQQNSIKKDFSRKYALGAMNVCREMFCRTLHISPGRINTALRKYRLKSALMDQRGLKQGGHNRLPAEKKNSVIRFLKRIPLYKSHYSKEKNKTKFLAPDMTLTKLFELYKEEEKDNIVSNASFKKIFYNSFNFKSRESCHMCDTLKNSLKKEQNFIKLTDIREKYEKHHSLAKSVQKYIDHDILLAKKYPEIECLTLEMGKMFPLPRISQSSMYYKRPLWLYNISIFSAKKEQSYCYVWPEGQAGKGAQEIGSCILKHAKEDIVWSPEISHIILWTYAYGGLIRNLRLILILKCLLQSYPTLKSIKIKFLESGHCSLPNHKDFIDIDKALKRNNPLFLPDDYVNLIRHCRKKKPLIVKNINNQEFLSTEQLEKHIFNYNTLTEKYKVNWTDILEVAIYSHQPVNIYYKTDFEGESSILDFSNCSNRQPLVNFMHMLMPLWPSGRPITQAKLKDLKSMLHLIPTNAKNFYLNLHCGTSTEEDVDGLNEQLDFEIE